MSGDDRTAKRAWISIPEVPNGWTLRPAEDPEGEGRQVPQKVR